MTDRNQTLFERAKTLIPGGVNSPVRAFGSVGITPRFFVSASGPYVTDVEGREYVDLVAAGVIDPVKVTRSALQNAASIAAMLLTTEALVVEKKEQEPEAGHAHGGHGHSHHGHSH